MKERKKDVRRREFIALFTYGPTIFRSKILDVQSCVEHSLTRTCSRCVSMVLRQVNDKNRSRPIRYYH